MTWVLDTQLVADWCLWDLEDSPGLTPLVRPGYTREVLRLSTDVAAFARAVAGAKVLVPLSVVVEAAGVVRREISTAHRGKIDRLNEPIVRVMLRFSEVFHAKVETVTEEAASEALEELNDVAEFEPRIDVGDAAVIATLSPDRSLLTADKRLFERCVNAGKKNVFRFVDGEVLDAKGNALRARP